MNFSKISLFILAVVIMASIFSGCSKEGMETSERLAGTWTVTTFTEYSSFIDTDVDIFAEEDVSSFTMTYVDETTAAGNVGEGSFTWNLVADGTSYPLEGTYRVVAESNRIELLFTSGSWADLYQEDPGNTLLDFNYLIENENTLSISGIVNGFPWNLEASK